MGSFFVTALDKIPSTRLRRTVTPLVTIVLVLIIIVAGVTIVYYLVISPGHASTSTIYP